MQPFQPKHIVLLVGQKLVGISAILSFLIYREKSQVKLNSPIIYRDKFQVKLKS